jgi:putative transposase
LKYRPGFPDRFGSIEDARGFCHSFFRWYNYEHHHSGLGLMTPAVVHLGKSADLLVQRQAVLDTAFQAHPERFVRQPPKPPSLPTAVWINKPPDKEKTP